MDTWTLLTFLKNMTRGSKSSHVDVLPADYLDNYNIPSLPAYLVVNSEGSNHPGQHWIAMYIRRKTASGGRPILEFFCSYGLGIDFYSSHFSNFVKSKNFKIIENTIPLQSVGSNVCGNYVLYFLYNRIKGCCPMSSYCKFSTNAKYNDARVERFVKLKKCLFKGPCKYNKIKQCCVNF